MLVRSRLSRNFPAMIEKLEDRRLMSVSLSGATNLGTLTGKRTFADSVDGSANTQDVRKFTMTVAGTFSASLSGLSANADLQLIKDTNNNLIVDSGETLATSAKTGTTTDSITNKSLSAGTYYLRVYSVGGASTSYSLSMTADYALQTLATARNVGTITGANSVFKDFVGSTDTDDFYKFSLATNRTLKASVTGITADANLQIIKDVNGNNVIDSGDVIASSSNTGTTSESISKFLSAGTYFARVFRVSGDTNYTLTLAAPSLLITFNYSFDASGFFTAHPTAKDRLNDAATIFSNLTDSLSAITPGSGNTWSEVISNPGTAGGPQVTISNPTVAANTIVIYVGGRSDLSGVELGQGGPGGFSASGTQSWLNTIRGRGQAGALTTPATDFGPWGGAITFSSTANWNFNSSAPTSSQNDFLSVALHEMGHVFGIGTAGSWTAKVSGSVFTGANATTANGGVHPSLDANHAHFAQGTKSTVNGKTQDVVMEPSLTVGTRRAFTRLDFAGLADIGWQVPSASLAASVTAAASNSTTTSSTFSAPERLAADLFSNGSTIDGEHASKKILVLDDEDALVLT